MVVLVQHVHRRRDDTPGLGIVLEISIYCCELGVQLQSPNERVQSCTSRLLFHMFPVVLNALSK